MSLIPSSAKSRLALAGGVAVIGLALTAAGVYASLQAQATNAGTPESVTSGVLSLTMAPGGGSVGFTSPVSGLAPGDTVNRYIDLTNSDAIPTAGLTLGAADGTPTPLSTDGTNGLQVSVASCSVAWDAANGTCSGTANTLASTSLAALTTGVVPLMTGAVPALQHLQVSLSLPPSSELTVNGVPQLTNTIQGRTASLTWTFTETQDTTPRVTNG